MRDHDHHKGVATIQPVDLTSRGLRTIDMTQATHLLAAAIAPCKRCVDRLTAEVVDGDPMVPAQLVGMAALCVVAVLRPYKVKVPHAAPICQDYLGAWAADSPTRIADFAAAVPYDLRRLAVANAVETLAQLHKFRKRNIAGVAAAITAFEKEVPPC